MSNNQIKSTGKDKNLSAIQKEKKIEDSGAIRKDAHISARNKRDQAHSDALNDLDVPEVLSADSQSESSGTSGNDLDTSELQIQVNSDHTIETSEKFSDYVRKVITDKVHNFQSQITRIEVHLSDENAEKGGENDKRCVMEARLASKKPIAVTDYANSVDDAVEGAAEKLKHALKKIIDREHDHHQRSH